MRVSPLTALLICPSRDLAQQFVSSLADSKSFQIVGDLKNYPTPQTLDIRLRQLQPEVVFIDLATNLDLACTLIELITPVRPEVHVVGIHSTNDPGALIRTLRIGAHEFLHAPFERQEQEEALGRLRRLRAPEPTELPEPELGRVVAFASAKPGSGASTLATQAAFALKRLTNKRVLLVDCDLMGGTIGFYLKVNHQYSLLDAFDRAHQLNASIWSALTVSVGGVDILPAPETPFASTPNTAALHDVLGYARILYDWIVLDLPAIFSRFSLAAIPESDSAYLVSTSELPSLHLARKAVALLGQLGVEKGRFQVVINRINKRDNISSSDMEKIFNCPVHATFPNDYFSLHRVVTLGQPLGPDSDLGRSIDGLAGRMSGNLLQEKRKSTGLFDGRAILSQA